MAYKIVDFYCDSCGNTQEVMVKCDSQVVQCYGCKVPMRKIISAPGMVKTNCNDKPGFRNRMMKKIKRVLT